jgi:hypothetical protein
MAETVTSITRPAPFIEAAGQTFLEGLQSAIPLSLVHNL